MGLDGQKGRGGRGAAGRSRKGPGVHPSAGVHVLPAKAYITAPEVAPPMVRKSLWILLALVVATVAFSGCTASRDIRDEAKDREAYARDHDDYDPIAFLSGPEVIAPGALVWYSAYGSHDPDFFGAREGEVRDQAREEGGVRFRSDYGDHDYAWYWDLAEEGGDGLGVGIREYEWRIDGGPAYSAHELTERYGSLDGPVRFPVGFTEPGTHELRLTVRDWSGAKDTARMTLQVADGGSASQIDAWSVTEAGWVYTREVSVDWQQYGECPLVSPGHYDPVQHHVATPWDIVFFMEKVVVEATWEESAAPGPLDMLSANLNDVDVTLGHCEKGEAWARFESDTRLGATELVEGGEVPGEDFASHNEITGEITRRVGEWDFNAYLSEKGEGQWGPGTPVTVRFTFVPAPPGATAYGGL